MRCKQKKIGRSTTDAVATALAKVEGLQNKVSSYVKLLQAFSASRPDIVLFGSHIEESQAEINLLPAIMVKRACLSACDIARRHSFDEVVELLQPAGQARLSCCLSPEDCKLVRKDIIEKVIGKAAPLCGRSAKSGSELKNILQSLASTVCASGLLDGDALRDMKLYTVPDIVDEVNAAIDVYDMGLEETSILRSLFAGAPWKELFQSIRRDAIAHGGTGNKAKRALKRLLMLLSHMELLERDADSGLGEGDTPACVDGDRNRGVMMFAKKLELAGGIGQSVPLAAMYVAELEQDHRDFKNFAKALESIIAYVSATDDEIDSVLLSLAERLEADANYDGKDELQALQASCRIAGEMCKRGRWQVPNICGGEQGPKPHRRCREAQVALWALFGAVLLALRELRLRPLSGGPVQVCRCVQVVARCEYRKQFVIHRFGREGEQASSGLQLV